MHERTILHKVPDTMPLALATLYQPFAAGIRWAVQVPKTEMGDTVLILGHGQRGLGAVVAAREAGASTIIVTGTSRSAHKLRLAENKYRLERLHTDEFTLDRAEEALQTLGRDRKTDQHPICVSLHPDESTMNSFAAEN